MRKVSQAWIDNQTKSIRDRNLLRVDFFSPQYNNNYAIVTGNNIDETLSNMDNIKSIFPYDKADLNGYVSDFLTDENGNTNILDYQLKFDFQSYTSPLDGLTIDWSTDGSYAVDFDLIVDGLTYSYLDNSETKTFCPLIIPNEILYFDIKIYVKKWSEANSRIKVERVFAGLHLSYDQNMLFDFRESKVNSVLGLEMPQMEISFAINNTDRKFDPLYQNAYSKYLSRSTEVRTYYGYDLAGGEEWIKGGTYYLSEWRAPSNSSKATFVAKDIFNLLDQQEIGITYDVSWSPFYMVNSILQTGLPNLINPKDYDRNDSYDKYIYKWSNAFKNHIRPYSDTLQIIDIESREYQLYSGNGILITYNDNSGIFTINGQPTSTFDLSDINFNFDLSAGDELTYSTKLLSQSGSVIQFFSNIYGESIINIVDSESQSVVMTSDVNKLVFKFNTSQIFEKFKFTLQLENGLNRTSYHIPINAFGKVNPLIGLYSKKEALQFLAHSLNCHLHLDVDSNIYFLKNLYNMDEEISISSDVLYLKPEFSASEPISEISVDVNSYSIDSNLTEMFRFPVVVDGTNIFEQVHEDSFIRGNVQLEDNINNISIVRSSLGSFSTFSTTLSGSGEAVVIVNRHKVNSSFILEKISINNQGTYLNFKNPMINTKRQAKDILSRISTEISNSINVELEVRLNPAFDLLDLIAFPFNIGDQTIIGLIRIDELELNYNGAYKGKIKGKYILTENLNLATSSYTLKTNETFADEETLLWHLQNN